MLIRTLAVVLLLAMPLHAAAARYVVHAGDTLTAIAQRYHVSLLTLARVNHLSDLNLVQIGRVLLIPDRSYTFYYRVRWGDTLSGLAARYSTSIASIRALNPSLGAYPLAGQWLRLCSPCASATGSSLGTLANAPGVLYVVQAGDSLSAIAARFGTSAAALAAANHIADPNLVVLGTHLSIPGSTGPAATRPQYSYDPWATRSLITAYAEQYGLAPALPLAVAWQESGFNQNEISRTGAIGVMQVEPYTGQHIAQLWGRPVNLYNLDDNVHAGVYWLAQLLNYYGGNERLAIAAYYQGTRALRRYGFFQDTVQYVNNVVALKSSFGG